MIEKLSCSSAFGTRLAEQLVLLWGQLGAPFFVGLGHWKGLSGLLLVHTKGVRSLRSEPCKAAPQKGRLPTDTQSAVNSGLDSV